MIIYMILAVENILYIWFRGKYEHGWVKMGADEFAWVLWGAGARTDSKTR